MGVILLILSIIIYTDNPHLLPLGLIIFSFAIILFSSALLIRLSISSNGIVYHQIDYSVFARWDQIAYIEECKAGRVRTYCFFLRGYELRGFNPLAKLSGLHPQKYSIPVGLFDKNWRDGNLGREIEQYAPHLLPTDR